MAKANNATTRVQTMQNRKEIKHIIFCEKQAQFYCVENSAQWRGWRRDALKIRRELGEYRPWSQLINVYDLRGEV
jgi:hypothetical protein